SLLGTPVLPTERIAQNRPPHFLARTSLSTRNRFTPNFQGWRLDENLKPKSSPYRGAHIDVRWQDKMRLTSPPAPRPAARPLRCLHPAFAIPGERPERYAESFRFETILRGQACRHVRRRSGRRHSHATNGPLAFYAMALVNLRRINRWADRSTMLRGLI